MSRNLMSLCALSLAIMAAPASAIDVHVTIENLAPANGNLLTPFWVGFHDGTFDSYNLGDAASAELERLAEDGNTAPLSGEFLASGAGVTDATILGPGGPIFPGEVATMTFDLDPASAGDRFFSYAAMVIPSNDAFVANDLPGAHPVFDELGNFAGGSFLIMGSQVLDAGTEVNDELPANTAAFGQMTPDTGVDEGGVIQAHPGFLPAGSGGILDDPMFAAAGFTQPGYQIARVTLSVAVPVQVKIENLAPETGGWLTPFWVGFHDGTFDIYDLGAPASAELERLAEDGNTAPLSGNFMASGSGTVDATILGPGGPIFPGEAATMTFYLDPTDDANRFFSYAAMVIPSNDAFVGSASPTAHAVFDEHGNFVGGSFVILGSRARDAGTEVNDEVPANTAAFGQMTPDTGVDEGGVIHVHPGFLPTGSGGILDDPMFAGADFTQPGYQIARITVSAESSTNVLELGDGRFRVTANWRNDLGETGEALGEELATDSGYFYFRSKNNVELVVKVLDGCEYNDHFWVFAAGLTNVEVELVVEDTASDEVRTYVNDLGTTFQPIQDVGAFATCPAPETAPAARLSAHFR